MKSIALENAAREGESTSVQEVMGTGVVPDFSEGLSRFLSGMCANISRDICSSTMAHLIVSNDGSRFEFSHDFVNFLVSQMRDVLNGKDAQFRIRSNYSKKEKRTLMWPDSTVDDYLYRSINERWS